VNFVECLCLFTDFAKLQAFSFQQELSDDPPAFPLQVVFVKCDDRNKLVGRLNTALRELAAANVEFLAINPEPSHSIAYIAINDFLAALPNDGE